MICSSENTLHALVLLVGQNELQTGLSPWGKTGPAAELDTLVAHLFSAILSETRPSRTYAEVSAVFRAQNYVKENLGCDGFWAHSAEQHADTDRARIGLIVTAIENALHAAESEHFGLSRKS